MGPILNRIEKEVLGSVTGPNQYRRSSATPPGGGGPGSGQVPILGRVFPAPLGVLPHQVVDAADGWATDGGVVSVMVVHVQPLVEGLGARRL